MDNAKEIKLKWIHTLRWIAILAQLCVLPYALKYGYLNKEKLPIYLLVPAFLTFFNLRSTTKKLLPFTNNISFQVIVDILAFTALILMTGRLENPFWPMIYMHAGMGAVLIEPKKDYQYLPFLVGSMALVQALSFNYYSTIAFVLVPQWVILLAIWFLTRNIGLLLLRQQNLIAKLNNIELKNQKLKSVGLLSSGILHEIGTPLNTVRLKVDRLKNTDQDFSQKDIEVLDKSLGNIEEILSKLNEAQFESEKNILKEICLVTLLKGQSDRWRKNNPEVSFSLKLPSETASAKVSETNLILVLNSLVTNSIEAKADKLEISLSPLADEIHLEIQDNGAGFSPYVLENFMAPYTSTKGKGRGIGLFNAGLTLESMGGSLKISNRNGALIQLILEKA